METYMTEMDLDKDIYRFLDGHGHARRPSPAPFQAAPRVPRGGLSQEEDYDELFNFFFDYPRYSSENGPSVPHGPTPNMSDVVPSFDNDTGSTAETSSILTPESVVSHQDSPMIDDGSLSPDPRFLGMDRPIPATINDLKSPPDPHLFPRIEHKENPRIHKHIQIPTPPHNSKKRTRSSSPPVQSRIVKDVDRTNQIRANGSCIKCRIQKITCDPVGVCESCTKAYPKGPECACFRRNLTGTATEAANRRFVGLGKTLELEAKRMHDNDRPELLESVYRGSVVFAHGHPSVRLPVTLQNYNCMSEDRSRRVQKGCVLAKGYNGVPQDSELIRWAEMMVSEEDQRTFEGSVEQFIKLYSEPCRSRGGYCNRPLMELMNKIHIMKSMYKICCEEEFVFIWESTGGVRPLPLLAQAELRTIARKAMESAERDILASLDKLFRPQSIKESERPAIWAALWQLMFIYRSLLRNVRPMTNDAESLLSAVAVFYAAHFRTSASLKLSLAQVGFETQQSGLNNAFEHALNLRSTHLQSIAAGVNDIDQRLKLLVVDPEMKVLNRRQPKKSAK
ncbi:hypothetical protein K4K52_005383 [Colletotrichum sp. SAR 10_76]|nr:hypothetical protein K4K52_005383 [Colletotrichum sp. SAR 10_76]